MRFVIHFKHFALNLKKKIQKNSYLYVTGFMGLSPDAQFIFGGLFC